MSEERADHKTRFSSENQPDHKTRKRRGPSIRTSLRRILSQIPQEELDRGGRRKYVDLVAHNLVVGAVRRVMRALRLLAELMGELDGGSGDQTIRVVVHGDDDGCPR